MDERESIDSFRELTPTDFRLITRQNRSPSKFLYIYHRNGTEILPLEQDTSLTVGRSRRASDFVLRVDGVSRRHARLDVDAEGEVRITDLESTNGTIVNGERITAPQLLEPGDEIRLGATAAVLHARDHAEGLPQTLLGHDDFITRVDQEIARSRTFDRTFGLLVVEVERGHESSLRRWCPELQRRLRSVDMLGLFSENVAEILLPEAEQHQVMEAAERVIASPPQTDQGEAVGIRCGLAMYPLMAASSQELVAVARQAAYRSEAASVVTADARNEAYVCVRPKAGPVRRGHHAVVVASNTRQAYNTARRVAASPAPVLIIGETGTGKELLARAIHENSARAAVGPMQAVNCAAIPPTLVESTLFGHRRGAFTGADQDAEGVFEAASGGTLLLDEIGELPPSAQAALLRVLETGLVRRVGSPREAEVDVRIVAATHRDLEALSETGAFRKDLLYRINVVTIRLPPLRERLPDIGPLCSHFVDEANLANTRRVQGIDAGATKLLRRYSWPGNVRELRNVIERAVLLATGDQITPHDLSAKIRGESCRREDSPSDALEALPSMRNAPSGEWDFRTRLQRIEAAMILDALREANWNQTLAAKALRIPPRTLTRKIKAYKIKKLGYALDDDDDDDES